jgi:hypothetical protein
MHYSEEELILHHYGEHDEGPAIARHLSECDACRKQFIVLQRVLGAVDAGSLTVPERGETYGADVWQRLRPRLPAQRPSWRTWLFPTWHGPATWAAAGAFAVLLLAAFAAGRYSLRPASAPPAPLVQTAAAPVPEQVRERVLLVAVGDHLDRSQMVLAELVNAGAPDTARARRASAPVDISDEQQWAHDLLASNRLYRQTAAQTGQTTVESVLDELEPILLDIAHSPSSVPASQLEELKRRIESQGLLFKIRIVESNVREQQRAHVAHAGPVS